MANRKLKKSSSSASWSNLNHDILFIIMMRLGFFDFVALSGVCKSWRSLALSNRNKFMVSKQPMKLTISTRLKRMKIYLEDYSRRKFKITFTRLKGSVCYGVTCGYLIFYTRKTSDFWVVNLFTRKELHFPGYSFPAAMYPKSVRGILVFSPSMSGWVFVVSHKCTNVISFSLAGEQARWRFVSSNSVVSDLHFFKGKLYMINFFSHLWELRLNREPTLTLHVMKNCPWPDLYNTEFLSSRENLYVKKGTLPGFEAVEVDFDEMKWVNAEKTISEYAVFSSDVQGHAAIKPDTWVHPWAQYGRFNCFRCGDWYMLQLWYFPRDYLYDNDSDMENGATPNVLKE